LTLFDEVEALSRAIRAGNGAAAVAIANARPAMPQAPDTHKLPALFRILLRGARCDPEVRIAMLDAWPGDEVAASLEYSRWENRA
jgi:hypothetical protein